MAQAIASSSVDLPAPLGPMMPVRPVRKVMKVSACWRKFFIRSETSLISGGLPRALHVLAAERHQLGHRHRLARGLPLAEEALHLLLERLPAHGRARGRAPAHFGRARVQVEVQRLGLPLAHSAMVEL